MRYLMLAMILMLAACGKEESVVVAPPAQPTPIPINAPGGCAAGTHFACEFFPYCKCVPN